MLSASYESTCTNRGTVLIPNKNTSAPHIQFLEYLSCSKKNINTAL